MKSLPAAVGLRYAGKVWVAANVGVEILRRAEGALLRMTDSRPVRQNRTFEDSARNDIAIDEERPASESGSDRS